MTQFVILAVLFVIALGFAVSSSRVISHADRSEQDSAARHRFLAAFDARSPGCAPAELLVQAFEMLARRLPDSTPASALRPGARLRGELGLTAEDVEDAALLVAARCEAPLPHGTDLDALTRDVVTVEEFVQFLRPFIEARGEAEAHAV